MALDGIFLHKLALDLSEKIVGTRIEKIYQPTKEELILTLSGRGFGGRLLLCAKGNSPRVQLTDHAPENPAVPPMFCMLMRKRLAGAKITDVSQPGLERILEIGADTLNELGDPVHYRLIIEIMARHSNIILTDGQGKIVDSIKRIDSAMSSVRTVLPGQKYVYPPSQDKVDLTVSDPEEVISALRDCTQRDLSKALLSVIQGVSPIVCRELSFLALQRREYEGGTPDGETCSRLLFYLKKLSQSIPEKGNPVMVCDVNGEPFDFCFCDIHQYGNGALTKNYSDYHRLLDDFYAAKDQTDIMRQRASDLLRILSAASDRIIRKLGIQRKELEECADRERLRIYGELINANIYRLDKGMSFCEVENYYDENGGVVRIPLDPLLTPAENAQQYYKSYRKADNAEKHLTELIKSGEEELQYIDSVFDALSRVSTARELAAIRAELTDSGYIRVSSRARQSKSAPLPPIEFISSDGFKILVGRNNTQNDKLTLKTAHKNDLWFHTKDIPGSHTVVITGGVVPPDRTITEAAILAAYHSKASQSPKVAVDHTEIRYVKKPQGAPPGRVIYTNQHTIYVTPLEETVKALAVREEK